jgi:SAM-dependent methyltransferase
MLSLENRKISHLLHEVDRSASILEIGSGYCQKTEFLKSLGFTNITGVEKNEALVDQAKTKNFNVHTVEEFEKSCAGKKYNVLFLSHIIEHFQYHDLKDFLEHYLDYLEENGYLLIATPVLNDNFYDDFDHVKPYTHLSILSVFGGQQSQVQFYSRHQLKLIDLQYIRIAYRLKFYRALALRTNWYRIPRIVNQLLHLIYRLSFRSVGQPIAWVGLFKKTSSNN